MDKNKHANGAQGATIANGTDKKNESAHSHTIVGENGQLNEPQTEAKEQPVLSVEEKIKRVFSLNDLIEKRRLLKNHLDKVETLKFGDYEEKDLITLTSSNGQSYAIKSSALCTKIAALLKEEITAKVTEVEAEINF